jgi:hypothetical protein
VAGDDHEVVGDLEVLGDIVDADVGGFLLLGDPLGGRGDLFRFDGEGLLCSGRV